MLVKANSRSIIPQPAWPGLSFEGLLGPGAWFNLGGINSPNKRGRDMRKVIGAVAAALLLAVTVNVSANDGFYVGVNASAYYLDSSRFEGGGENPIVGGVQLGYRFFNKQMAVEAGWGSQFGSGAFETLKADFFYFIGDDVNKWRPYVTVGYAYYEQDTNRNPTLDNSNQKYTDQGVIGAGLAKMIADHWEFRGDVRYLGEISGDSSSDASLNFAINYYFRAPPAEPVVVAVVPAPAPAPAPEPEIRTITVRLNVEFEFDKAVVRAIYGDELEAVANAMKVHEDIELVLEGHTDSVGSEDYNQGLSERRVAAVEAKLAEDYGIDPNRIATVGYGETRPIADNDTAEGRAQNRRVIGEMSFTEVVVD
ncbi:MAG: hypothetical protein DRR06_09135 [Gammaproteobacteria bacterium]|nr:MAG: hypothetical protein DRR06_09135 [Gammaproteobacteria bacterium]